MKLSDVIKSGGRLIWHIMKKRADEERRVMVLINSFTIVNVR